MPRAGFFGTHLFDYLDRRFIEGLYSAKCLEEEFCELRLYGVLGSSPHAQGLLAFQPVLYGTENGDDEKVPTSIW